MRLLVLLGSLVPFVVFGQAAPTAGLQADFELFLKWFPGRYDNALQVRQQSADYNAPSEKNYRRHSIFRRVDLPAFGDVVFYAEQYRDGDPQNIYRQRIYELSLVPERGAFRLRVHIPKDVEALRGAYRDTSLLIGLTPEAATVWEGCDVFWIRIEDRFEGSLDEGTCRFYSPRYEAEVKLEETLTLTENALWFADRGLTLDGEYLFGMQGDEPAKALRARPVRCEVIALVSGVTTNWWMHDQGGVYRFDEFIAELQRLGSSTEDMLTFNISGEGVMAFVSGDGERVVMEDKGDAIQCTLQPGHGYEDGR